MLIYQANQQNKPHEWRVAIFQQRFPRKAFHDELTPAPPTVLFKLEMKAIEAQQRVKQVERLMKDDTVAA
jgi:hypothetical protein